MNKSIMIEDYLAIVVAVAVAVAVAIEINKISLIKKHYHQ